MLGIIVALPEEVNELLKSKFNDIFSHKINGKNFYILKTINNQSVVFTFSGVGKVNAAYTTALLINNFKIDKCLNIGSSCGIYDLKTFDVLIVDKTSYGDVDVTDFGYDLNQIPKMPSNYLTDNSLNAIINNIVSLSNYTYKLGNCYTCDSFVKKDNISKFNLGSKWDVATAIDMECCGIAQVCHLMNVKFAAIKIISDELYAQELSAKQFETNLQKISLMIDDLSYNIIQAIGYEEDRKQ